MGIRIKVALAAILLSTLTAGTPGGASAQTAQEVTGQEFREFVLNDSIDLVSLQEMAGDWAALKAAMGDPETESCKDLIVGEDCTFTWPGVTAYYTTAMTGDWEVAHVLIDHGALLKFGTSTIRPGDSVQTIAVVFPEAYANRGSVSGNNRWNCAHYAALRAGRSTLRICYDPATETIQRMVWWNYF